MKKIHPFVTIVLVLLVVAVFSAVSPAAEEAPYRHVVLFKFKEDASREEVQKVERAFAALKGKIPLIKDYEWGINESPEGHDNGFTHCFFVTFDKRADLEAYLPHEEHKKFVAILKPHLDKVLVVDYVAQSGAE